jgi:myo-inositol-1(or 4)-monophosphatase
VTKPSQEIGELKQFAVEMINRLGEKALTYYGRGDVRLKFDESLVTKAELELTEFFQEELHANFPEHLVFSSSPTNRDYSHEGKRYLWIHDAIEGVANFQAGIPIWGVSLSLLENFWPVFGAFHMPATGDIFHAQAGQKAFRGEEEIRVSTQEYINDESLLFTYSRFHNNYSSTFPGKIRDLGCTVAHLCYVAMGRAEAAVIANESYPDLAAARVIVEAAGGKIYKMDGSEFFLNEYLDEQRIEEHLLVVSPDNYSQVRNCLQETS